MEDQSKGQREEGSTSGNSPTGESSSKRQKVAETEEMPAPKGTERPRGYSESTQWSTASTDYSAEDPDNRIVFRYDAGQRIDYLKSGLMSWVRHPETGPLTRDSNTSIINVERMLREVDPTERDSEYRFSLKYHFETDDIPPGETDIPMTTEVYWEWSTEPSRKHQFAQANGVPVDEAIAEFKEAVAKFRKTGTPRPDNIWVPRDESRGFDGLGVDGDQLHLDARSDRNANAYVLNKVPFLEQYDDRHAYRSYFEENPRTSKPIRTPWIEVGYAIPEKPNRIPIRTDKPRATHSISSMETYACNLRDRLQMIDSDGNVHEVDMPLHAGMSFVQAWMFSRLFPVFHAISPKGFICKEFDKASDKIPTDSASSAHVHCTKQTGRELNYLLAHTAKCIMAFYKCYEVIGMEIDDASAYKATRLGRFWYFVLEKNYTAIAKIISENYVEDRFNREALAKRWNEEDKTTLFCLPLALTLNESGRTSKVALTENLLFTHAIDPTVRAVRRNESSPLSTDEYGTRVLREDYVQFTIEGHQRTPFAQGGRVKLYTSITQDAMKEYHSFTPFLQYLLASDTHRVLHGARAALMERRVGDTEAFAATMDRETPVYMPQGDKHNRRMVCRYCGGACRRDRSMNMKVQEMHAFLCPEVYPWSRVPAQLYLYVCRLSQFFAEQWPLFNATVPGDYHHKALQLLDDMMNVSIVEQTAGCARACLQEDPDEDPSVIRSVARHGTSNIPASKQRVIDGEKTGFVSLTADRSFNPRYTCRFPVDGTAYGERLPPIYLPFEVTHEAEMLSWDRERFMDFMTHDYMHAECNRFTFGVEAGFVHKGAHKPKCGRTNQSYPSVYVENGGMYNILYYGDDAPLDKEIFHAALHNYSVEYETLKEYQETEKAAYNPLLINGELPDPKNLKTLISPRRGPKQYVYLQQLPYPQQKPCGVVQMQRRVRYVPNRVRYEDYVKQGHLLTDQERTGTVMTVFQNLTPTVTHQELTKVRNLNRVDDEPPERVRDVMAPPEETPARKNTAIKLVRRTPTPAQRTDETPTGKPATLGGQVIKEYNPELLRAKKRQAGDASRQKTSKASTPPKVTPVPRPIETPVTSPQETETEDDRESSRFDQSETDGEFKLVTSKRNRKRTASSTTTDTQQSSRTADIKKGPCRCDDIFGCGECMIRHRAWEKVRACKTAEREYEWKSGLWRRYRTMMNLPEDTNQQKYCGTHEESTDWFFKQGDQEWHRLNRERNLACTEAKALGPNITPEAVERSRKKHEEKALKRSQTGSRR